MLETDFGRSFYQNILSTAVSS